MEQTLPAGVRRINFQSLHDERGCLTEIFRGKWDTGVHPVQWNIVSSLPDTLRGFHVHKNHYDYLVMSRGTMILGLKDLRSKSPTFGLSTLLTLSGEKLEGLKIPPGVGHGFFYPEESMLIYAVSEYWDPIDELGCRWDDPGLGLEWPITEPLLSERDKDATTLGALMETIQQHEFPKEW